MLLNEQKTKLIVFNSHDACQAIPFVALDEGEPLQCVDKFRLLGVIFDHNLTWWGLINDIEDRVRKKVWAFLKLRESGATVEDLKCMYIARIKATIEVQVFVCLIGGVKEKRLEFIQLHFCNLSHEVKQA